MVAKKVRKTDVKSKYDASLIEKHWQEIWEKSEIYNTSDTLTSKKYVLDMFPYPSGATLHVGHVEGYVGTDIISRYLRMKGNNVLHPMGWDAFGLPSENYAIKTGVPPHESTHKNIETFKRQLSSMGMSYDWNFEIDTSDPLYYRWTQSLFILLFKKGLAYKKKASVNWCPSCETVLANEQVESGKCERCDSDVVLKDLDQWFFKITDYADRLIYDLDKVDWLDEVKVQQKNWIGKSYGCEIQFQVSVASDQSPKSKKNQKPETETWSLTAFTTRPDTLFGVTFLVIGADSELIEQLVTLEQKKHVDTYLAEQLASQGVSLEPEGDLHNKSKEGVWTGSYVVNPATGKNVPVWLANYVVSGYGSEAVMGVPAHDQRDYEFAKKYDLEIVPVIQAVEDNSKLNNSVPKDEIANQPYLGAGLLVNSGEWDGMFVPEDLDKVIASVEAHGWGSKKTSYHLRDWLISRQRYWGAPIPMVYCDVCARKSLGERDDLPGWYTVADADLPVLLPLDVDFKPTGESPIARSKTFQEGAICPNCGAGAKREVDTMDTFVDSSWYFVRFVDPKNKDEFASKEKIKAWLPVDIYVGGGHVVQHLLFARFFWKVMFDAGLIDKSLGDEPFLKLRAPGWILGSDSRKMSKRWGNVITPDDIIPKYGADTLRMYEMFMGPFEAMKPWSLNGVEGMYRFIGKIWRLFEETNSLVGSSGQENDKSVDVLMNKLIMKVGNDIESMSFNTAISAMMITYNSLVEMKRQKVSINWARTWKEFLLVLAPFAPHMAEELWQKLNSKHEARNTKYESVHLHPWPEFDPALIVEDIVEIPVQVNGKHRGTVQVQVQDSENQEIVENQARKNEAVSKHLDGAIVKKVIFVAGRLVNFVV